jgi:hypothetical protein
MVRRITRSAAVAAMVASAVACASDAASEQPIVPATSPSVSEASSAQEIAWDRAAQASLRNSLAAALTYYTDAASFDGLTPETIAEIEPSLAYVGAAEPSRDDLTLSVAVARKGQIYAAAAMSGSGRCYTIRDDRDHTTYGVIDDGSDCTGDAALDASQPTWD